MTTPQEQLNHVENETKSKSPDSGLDSDEESDDDEEFHQQRMVDMEEQLLQACIATLSLTDGLRAEQQLEDGNPEEEELEGPSPSLIESIRFTQEFIDEIRHATLDNGKLDKDVVNILRNPIEEPVDLSAPHIRLSLDLYVACDNASEATYTAVRQSILRCFPECDVLSYYRVKQLVAESSGVVSVLDDMCINSCHAFVGPYADLTSCNKCSEPRYHVIRIGQTEKRVPRKQASTIPLGPQIQALRRSPRGAAAMRYRDQKVMQVYDALDKLQNDENFVYDDIFCGNDFLNLSERYALTSNDTTVLFSLDGAQLYQNKKSDTWIAIWVILDYDPKTRYQSKHILPALIIPGPNKPKELDSFLFRGFHHLSSIQRENNGAGLRVWDGLQAAIVSSRIFFHPRHC